MGYIKLPIISELEKSQKRKLYVLQEAWGAADMDDWNHWIEHNDRSYHLSREGAEKALKKMIKKEVAELIERGEKEGEDSYDYYDIKIEETKDNRCTFQVGTDGSEEVSELFIIDVRELKD